MFVGAYSFVGLENASKASEFPNCGSSSTILPFSFEDNALNQVRLSYLD